MERPDKNETLLKTFNTAKLFAEGILFPKMKMFQDFQTQADFGAKTMDEALELSEETRDLQRYNGLKGMTETVLNLLYAISSTVRLKRNQEEIKQLNSLIEYINTLREMFYNHREKFFIQSYKDGSLVETIERKIFEETKTNVNLCYINTEILMTRNKLLFADANDEYQSDSEILEQLKKEYVEG